LIYRKKWLEMYFRVKPDGTFIGQAVMEEYLVEFMAEWEGEQ